MKTIRYKGSTENVRFKIFRRYELVDADKGSGDALYKSNSWSKKNTFLEERQIVLWLHLKGLVTNCE